MKRLVLLSLLVGSLVQAQFPPTPVSQDPSSNPWTVNGTVTATVDQTATIASLSSIITNTTGLATSAKQDTQTTALGTINTTLGSPFQAGGSIGNTAFGISGTLPAFASTPTFNVGTTGGIALDSTLSALSAKFGSLGQKAMAGSAPVVVASDQSAIPVTGPLTDTQLRATAVPISGTVTANAGTNLNTSALNLETTQSAFKTANHTDLGTINTTLGTPFQAGGSIGNTTFGATQATAANLNATVVGTAGAALATAANQTTIISSLGTLATKALQTTGNTTLSNIQDDTDFLTTIIENAGNGSGGAGGYLSFGAVNYSTPTFSDTTVEPLQMDSGGNLKVYAPYLSLSPNITTSGNSGPLIQGSVTSAAPSYTNAKTNFLSLDTGGNLRVLVGSGSQTSVTGNVSVIQATGTNLHAVLDAGSAIIGKVGIDQTTPGTTNLVAAGQNGTWTVQPGNTANTTAWLVGDSADATNGASAPVKSQVVGGVFNTSPATLSTGTVGSFQLDSAQNLLTRINVALPAGGNTIGNVGLVAGSAVIGHVIADTGSTTAVTGNVTVVQGTGSNLHVAVDSAPSTAVTNAGTFAVQATVAASATNIAKAEDSASANADVGVPAMVIRESTPGDTTVTDGDYEFLQMLNGRLWTSTQIDTSLPAGSAVIGALTANQSVNVSQINGVTPLMGNGTTGTGSLRVTLATDTSSNTNPLLFNQSQINGVAVTTGLGNSDTGTQRVTIASDSQVQVSLGSSTGKTVIFKSGSVITSATTARQVILTYTVTSGKTFYMEYANIEGKLTNPLGTASVLGIASLESPAVTTIASHMMMNPTTSTVDRINYYFAEPIPIPSGTVIRAVTSPNAVTNMSWVSNFGGYEK